ncbi:sialate O-acetylesterase [Luteolibacter soli]|uniref:Sialate O-acetylesterase n=1 Tax=Luteolibacter soli TaxID=3135280 RepID=A0ABU9AUP1_9BACT
MRRILAIVLACLFTGPTHAQSKPATTPLPAKENFHLYLLMGQSNMVGRDRKGMDTSAENPRILSLNPEGQWVIAKDPLHPKIGAIEPGIGPGLSFATEMLKDEKNPKVTIGLIPCAVGGTPLKRWVKDGDLYKQAIERAKAASKDGVIKGVLWHQGESDTEKPENADTYGTRLTGMLKDLRKDLSQPDLPIVVGQLGEFLALTPEKFPCAATVQAAIKKIPDTVPHTGYADSAGLGHKGDKLHFNTEGAKEFGTRFATAMKDLQKPKKKP